MVDRCGRCNLDLEDTQSTWGFDTIFEVIPAKKCPKCRRAFTEGRTLEEASQKVARKLVDLDRRDARAVWYVITAFGVFIPEILKRFPSVTRQQVRMWRHGNGESVPNEVAEWAFQIARDGGIKDCVCGRCIVV